MATNEYERNRPMVNHPRRLAPDFRRPTRAGSSAPVVTNHLVDEAGNNIIDENSNQITDR